MTLNFPTFRPGAFVAPLCTLVAVAAAAMLCFGQMESWAHVDGGIDLILWTRRLQWVLVGICLAACIGIVGAVVGGGQRAWWLVVLIPVLALFAQRFAGDTEAYAVADDPAFAEAEKVEGVSDNDWVVALKFGDQAFAYPYATLYCEPVVVQTEHDRKLALFWNARANRVTAFEVASEFRGRDLDIVSAPAGSLLVYNSAHAQFIVGVTGLTPERQKPTGILSPLATSKMTFGRWKQLNPTGKVMKPGRLDGTKPGPTAPIDIDGNPLTADAGKRALPPATGPTTKPAPRRVTLVGNNKPLAIDLNEWSGKATMVKVDDHLAVMLRSEATVERPSGIRAFQRKLDDLMPRFEPAGDSKLSDVRMRDVETGSLWSSQGVAVGGNAMFRGRRLPAIPVDDNVDFEAIRRWIPDVAVYEDPAPPPAAPAVVSNNASKPGTAQPANPARRLPAAKRAPAPQRRVVSTR